MLRGTIIEAPLESSSSMLESVGERPGDYDSSEDPNLLHAAEIDRILSDPAASNRHSSESAGPFNLQLFWILSSVAFLVLTGLFLWCCKRRGASFVEEWTNARASGNLSDVGRLRRLMQIRLAEEERKKECPEKRKERLMDNIKKNGVVLVVKDSDFVMPPGQQSDELAQENEHAQIVSEEGTMSNEDGDDAHSFDTSSSTAPTGVVLPPAASNGNRTVPNCCAVCLCQYDIGDTLVWSSNAACQHAFHRDCAIEWLGKIQDGTPCPCCRQEFTDLPPFDPDADKEDPLQITQRSGSEISVEGVPAFSVNAISLR